MGIEINHKFSLFQIHSTISLHIFLLHSCRLPYFILVEGGFMIQKLFNIVYVLFANAFFFHKTAERIKGMVAIEYRDQFSN